MSLSNSSSLGDVDDGVEKPTRSVPLYELRLQNDTTTVFVVAGDSKIGDTVVRKGDRVRYMGSHIIGTPQTPSFGGCEYWFYVERANGEKLKTYFYNDFGSEELLCVEGE